MKRMEWFAQCRLVNGRSATIGFIPAKAAVVGCVVELEIDGRMQAGWRVESVGKPIAKDAMRQLERQHTSQREGSDI
ncbi:MAG: hypothetical protein AAF750_03150 [Planctomycetota bacterium]